MPALLFFEPQDFDWPPSNAISIFGAEDKEKAGCGQYVAIYANGRQSIHTIVAQGQAPSAYDHNFNTEHLIPSVNYCMNITSDAGDYIYSGGEEGWWRVYVSVDDAKFDPSTGIKHATNILHCMSTSICTNE